MQEDQRDPNQDPGQDPTQQPSAPSGPKLTPIPGMLGAQYDPATGDVYDQNGNKVPGHYDAGSNTLTDPTGKQFVVGSTPKTNPGGWQDPNVTPVTNPPPPGPGPGPGPGPSTGTGSLYGPFGPFTGQYQPLQGTPTGWQNLPAAPQWKDIPTFNAPTMDQAKQDPGYQFGLQQGQQALTQDKAQQGLLYGGGTLKDILEFGQNYATQRYNDVYNRMKDVYMTNTENQYILPYQEQMQAWQTLVPAVQRQNEFLTNQNYQKWLQDYNMWNNNRNYALDAATRLS